MPIDVNTDLSVGSYGQFLLFLSSFCVFQVFCIESINIMVREHHVSILKEAKTNKLELINNKNK